MAEASCERGAPREAYPASSDADLVARALAGEREAFGDLVDRYGRMVAVLVYQRVGRRADAEDLCQEAFLKAWAALGTLREPGKFASWLYNITFKLCVDWHRSRGRHAVSLDDLRAASGGVAEPADAAAAAGDAVERRERQERCLAALGQLPDKYRLILTLRFLRGMSYKEIAEHLGEPAGTVANRLFRAHAMLKERLERAERIGSQGGG